MLSCKDCAYYKKLHEMSCLGYRYSCTVEVYQHYYIVEYFEQAPFVAEAGRIFDVCTLKRLIFCKDEEKVGCEKFKPKNP